MIFAYNLVLLAASVLFLPYLFYRVFSGKDSLASYRQKLGFYNLPPVKGGGVWVHGVSVGETNTAIPLLGEIKKRLPGAPLTYTTSTATGMGLAVSRLEGVARCAYFPLDFHFSVKSSFSFFKPSLVVFMETEIWPNFLRISRMAEAKVILVNGRISDRSFRRYLIFKPVVSRILAHYSHFFMQSREDAEKIIALGADARLVEVTGNLKFDRSLPDLAAREEVRDEFKIPAGKRVIVFASTHPGEDEIFIKVALDLAKAYGDLFFVIVPRHVHRAGDIESLCRKDGISAVLRSKKEVGDTFLILDTIGELAHLYGAAHIAVMGGSFVPHGGQNPLEASSWGVPVVFGPHMNNFRDIAKKLTDSGGAVMVRDARELVRATTGWLDDGGKREMAGRSGRETVIANRGTLDKTVTAVEKYYRKSFSD